MTQSVFYGFDAYVGAIVGRTQIRFWAANPTDTTFNNTSLIDVDLARNPEACRRGQITPTQIQVDDFSGYKLGGHTTVGPDYPLGSTVGGCWLESTYWGALAPGVRPPRVPIWRQTHEYDMTTIYDWTTFRRYYGFYAEIVSEQPSTSPSYALVSIWPAGRSLVPNTPPSGTVWIDFTTDALAPASVPAAATAMPSVWVGSSAPKKGPLFLDQEKVKLMPFEDGGSKHPLVLGYGSFAAL